MATYVVREATVKDAETIRGILREEIALADKTWKHNILPENEFNDFCFGAKRSLHPLVAEYRPGSETDDTGKSMVGCVLFSKIIDYYFGNQSYIQGLAVKREHRMKGVGKKLLAAAMKYGLEHGCKSAFATIKRNNIPSMTLFECFNGNVVMPNFCMVRCTDLENILQHY